MVLFGAAFVVASLAVFIAYLSIHNTELYLQHNLYQRDATAER